MKHVSVDLVLNENCWRARTHTPPEWNRTAADLAKNNALQASYRTYNAPTSESTTCSHDSWTTTMVNGRPLAPNTDIPYA
jgi:hypothetical protein